MPLPSLNIQHHAAGHHINSIRQPPLGVIKVLLKVPPNTHASLRRTIMSVNRHRRPRLQRIKHTLAIILRAIPQVQVTS